MAPHQTILPPASHNSKSISIDDKISIKADIFGLENADPDTTNTAAGVLNLYKLSLLKFDKLVQQGEILWAESTPEQVDYEGFKVEFRIAPGALSNKPIHPSDHPNRRKPTASNPFLNPDPNFIIAHVATSHILLLNKYCILRPQLILHTVEFEKQEEPLSKEDLCATWDVLRVFEEEWERSLGSGKGDGEEGGHQEKVERQAVIYNCGVEGGSSQGHRHLQLFPRPSREILFPDSSSGEIQKVVSHGNDDSSAEVLVETNFPNVPYKHGVIRLSPNTSKRDVCRAYFTLLEYFQSEYPSEADENQATPPENKNGNTNSTRNFPHNLFLVSEWIAVIPRRHARGGDPGVGSNSAGMMGAIWLKDQVEREGWDKLGVRKHLAYLGIPVS